MSTILITDGSLPTRSVRSRILRDAGYQIVEARSARAAVDAVLLDSTAIALALIDVALPDSDGFELCQELKTIQPALPVVLISAVYRSAQARRDGFGAGADAYLVEPMPPARLVQAIRRLVTGHDDVVQQSGVVRTTRSGCIIWVDGTAARLLNIGERAAPGRNLLTFFNGGRAQLQEEIVRAEGGQVCEMEASLRPRERRPLDLHVDLSTPSDGQPGELEWLLEPVARSTGPGTQAAPHR
jgi:DNA-binding response OmpR family regulator